MYGLIYTQTRDLTKDEWNELCRMCSNIADQCKRVREAGAFGTADSDLEWFTSNGRMVLGAYEAGMTSWTQMTGKFLLCDDPISGTTELHKRWRSNTACCARTVPRICKHGPGGKYSETGAHIATYQRLWDIGPADAPRYSVQATVKAGAHEIVAKAVLLALYTRFPGSVTIPDMFNEEEWDHAMAWATAALPDHAFVPNLGRRFVKRMWDKVRCFVLTVQPALFAWQLRAAERVYADGAPEVDALQADFEQRAAEEPAQKKQRSA